MTREADDDVTVKVVAVSVVKEAITTNIELLIKTKPPAHIFSERRHDSRAAGHGRELQDCHSIAVRHDQQGEGGVHRHRELLGHRVPLGH